MDARGALGGTAGLLLVWACAAGGEGTSPEEAAPPRPEEALHARIDLPSIAACGGCHPDVYAEWAQSLHARAWTNPNARAATAEFTKEGCRPCHSPMPVLATGLLRRPDYRDFNQEDGVHCLSCHGLPEGAGVAAARTVPDAPCRPRYEPRLLSVDHCYPCHEPTHGAFSEYETSDAYALGVRCVDCHMQPTVRDGGRAGRSHGPNGGMNAEFVRRAIGWSAELDGGAALLTVRNRTGHRFPGEIPSRSFVVRAVFDAGDDATVVLRKPHRGEPREDDRLRPDEERVLRFELPPGALSVELTLLFRPLPLLPLEECFELGRWEGSLD